MQIDDMDRRILHEVQLNNQLTSAQISEHVGLSPTSVQRRLNRLRRDGIIEADVSIVSHVALGRPLIMMVSVELERERSDIIDRFKRSVHRVPEIMSAYYVTGDSDFILMISARDMEDYEKFTRDFFYDNADIKGFKTTVVMDRIKTSFYISPGT
jgi:Lrp/AsnC family transcriptional regulator, leucine-responsive regulatory protein